MWSHVTISPRPLKLTCWPPLPLPHFPLPPHTGGGLSAPTKTAGIPPNFQEGHLGKKELLQVIAIPRWMLLKWVEFNRNIVNLIAFPPTGTGSNCRYQYQRNSSSQNPKQDRDLWSINYYDNCKSHVFLKLRTSQKNIY